MSTYPGTPRSLVGVRLKKETAYTNAAAVYYPTEHNALCYVQVQASGAGGSNSAVAGGGGGAYIGFWTRVPSTGISLVAPAGGAVNTDGGKATFGTISVQGGKAGTSISSITSGVGGLTGVIAGAITSTNATMSIAGMPDSCPGGAGGNNTNSGNLAGFPANANAVSNPALGFGDTYGNNGQGAGSGGDSYLGKGNPSNTAPDQTQYGAGGGYFQPGSQGLIRVYDYGAEKT